MYTVLYRWKLDETKLDQFIKAWEIVTRHYLLNHGALGSRLHKTEKGDYAAYAQWPTKADREKAFSADNAPHDAVKKMQEAILERFTPIEMYVLSDLLKPATE